MFDWLRRLLLPVNELPAHALIDTLNAAAGDGEPITATKGLGSLAVGSGVLALGDPMCVPDLEIPNILAKEVSISASLWRYPSGFELVRALALRFDESTTETSYRKIGVVGIDSAKLVVADKDDLQNHWTESGKDRLGVISTALDDCVLQSLTKQFDLATTQVNPVRAEVVGPVTEALEKEILEYLKTRPECVKYPFMYFRVETNNSFDRANKLADPWEFMPIGNKSAPLMFVCETGRGDGSYDVTGQFSGEVPEIVTITFIDDGQRRR